MVGLRVAEAFAYALKLAKSWEGVSGPRISINGVELVPAFWPVDEVLLFEKVGNKALGQK